MVRTVLSLPALAAGILLAWAGYFHQLKDHAKVASWVKTPCQILSWGVSVTPSAFGLSVHPGMSYEYHFGGRKHRSYNYDEATDWEVDLRDFEAEGDAARRGPAFCYVNPDKPSEASFRAARLWFPYSLIGGGAALALVALIFLIRTYVPVRIRSSDKIARDRRADRYVLGILSLGLLGIGLYQFWKLGFVDAIRAQVVRSHLIQVPARVEGTGIVNVQGTGRNRHLTYHKSHIVYSYEHGGRRWHSDRWYFDARQVDVGSMEASRALLAKYPAGLEMGIWILPDKPWYATLNPEIRWDFFWLLIPLSFIAGSVWVGWNLRPRRS